MKSVPHLAHDARRLATFGPRPIVSAILVAVAAAALLTHPRGVLGQGFGDLAAQAAAAKQELTVRIEKQIQDLSKQTEQLQARQSELRAKVRNQSGLSPENVKPMLLNLERERFTLELESKLKLARREQLARLIAEEASKASDQIDKDEVTEHLKKIVQSRKDLVKIKNRDQTNARIANVGAAEAELAEAEVRLAMRKQELLKSRAGAGLEQLNQQLQAVSLEAAQDTLRLELLKERLDSLGAVESVLDSYKVISEVELPRLLRMLEQTQAQKGQIEFISGGGGGLGGGLGGGSGFGGGGGDGGGAGGRAD